MTYVWIAYAVVGLVFGYFISRASWREGGSDYPAHSFGISLIFGVGWAVLWPLALLFFVIYSLCQRSFWENLGCRIWGG